VLDVTRNTVKLFESTLAEKISVVNAASKGKSNLIHLDFFKQLLTEDGTGFNMRYHLDSTHLKPIYVQEILRPALNRLFVPRLSAASAAAAASGSSASVPVPAAAPQSIHSMSTMDAINARLAAAERGDFSDEIEDVNPHGMD
jgi:hypothetical protein